MPEQIKICRRCELQFSLDAEVCTFCAPELIESWMCSWCEDSYSTEEAAIECEDRHKEEDND